MMLFRYLRSHWIKTLEECRFKMASVTDFNDPFDGCGRCEGCLNGQGAEAFLREGNPLTSTLMGKTMAVKGYELSLRQAVQNRNLVSEVKALCFSACEDGDPSQKLMWAHYANGYRGVRIGLQLDDPNFPLYLDSVKYCQERPTLNLSKIKSVQKDEEVLRFWISNLTTKSNEWAMRIKYTFVVWEM